MSPPSSSSSSSFEVVVGGGAAVSSNLGGWTVQDLSYQDMAVDETGAVLSRDRKERLRLKHGYCPTCPTIPIQLYTMKRSRLNPLWSSKTPRSVEAECHNGMCLKCCGSSASSSTAATTNAAAAAAARSRSVSSLPTIQSSSAASPLLHAPSVSSGASFRSTATAATTTTTSPEATSSIARAPRSHTMTTTNHHPSSHAHSHRHPASLPQSPPMKRTGTRRIGGTRHSTSRGGGALVPPPPWALEEEGEESSHSSNSSPTTPVSSATTNKKNKDTCNPSLNDSLSTTSGSSRFTMPSLVPAASVSTTTTDSTTTATSTATTTHSPTSVASTTATTVSSSPLLHSRSTHSVRNNSPTTGGPVSSSSLGGSSSRSLLLSSSSNSLRSMNSSSHHTHNAASTTTTTTMHRQSTRTNMMIREASVRSAVSTLSDGPSYHSSNHTTTSSPHHPQHTTGELGGRQASTQSLELVVPQPHQHHSSKEHDDWMESATTVGGGGGHESLSTWSELHLSGSNHHTSPRSVLSTNTGRSMEQEPQEDDTNKNHTDPQELFLSLQDDDDEKQSPQDQHHDKQDPQDYPHVAQVVLDDLQSLVHQLVLASSWTVLANVLANAMKQHASYHAAVARFCLSTLAEYYGHGGDGGTPTANHEQEQQQPQGSIQLLWHVQVDKWLVHAMKQHPHDPVVQEQACRLAHCLLLAPDEDDDNNHSYHQDWLVQAQLPWYLYQAMRQFGTESVAVAIHGMAVARSLSIHATARSVWNDISRQDSGGASSSSSSCGFVFVQVMHHHPTVAQVQRDACALLNNLAVDLEQYHVSTVPPDTLQGVLLALQNRATHDDDNNNNDNNNKSSSVVSSALFALQNLTYNDTNLGTLCRLPNVCRILHQVVVVATTCAKSHNDSENAQMLLERVQLRQTQDLSLEEQALESLQAHIQLKQDDPHLLVDVLAVCDAHSGSQQIVSTGLQHIGQVVVTSSSSFSSSRQQQLDHFLCEETALSRVQAHLVTFASDPVVAPTAQAILQACASDKHK